MRGMNNHIYDGGNSSDEEDEAETEDAKDEGDDFG